MLTDYHTHTERGPYTVEWLEKFLAKAKQGGIAEFGVSEHGYRFKQTQSMMENAWMNERRGQDLNEYMQMVMDARKAGHVVRFGLELDYKPGISKLVKEFIASYPFDYVIGSCHWLGDFGFDLLEMKEEWDRWDVMDAYEQYFTILIEMSEARLFDFLGHPDVIKVMGHEPEDQAFLNKWYRRLAKSFKTNDQVIEISTAGLRKPVGKLYPASGLLQACREEGVPILINSDAHRPEDVGADYDQAILYAKQHGYTHLVTFENHVRTYHPIG